MVSEEKMFVLIGAGSNGKTTVAVTIADAMGEYATKGRRDLLLQSQGERGSASPDVAALQGRRLVLISETDDGCSLAEAQVKEITANEPTAARRLYGDSFAFRPTHKLVLLTNHRPFVKGTDDGIWRRLDIFEFSHKIEGRSKSHDFRETRLVPELEGILAWMVQGCLKWQADGLKMSRAVRRATDQYRSEMDLVGLWLEDCCELTADSVSRRSSIYDNYRDWSQSEHVPPLGRRRFLEELRTRGYKEKKSNGDRMVLGLALKCGRWPSAQ
jgi:putative DNA primase/helicase